MVDGERTIIESAVKGEASAFGQLYDHYQPKIYRFVMFKVGQREEAEDLTHEVFLSAWQKIRNYRDFGFPFSSWLYQIARNRIIDHYRTKKVSTSIDAVDPEYFVAPAVASMALEEKLEVERVRHALRKLKPEYQDVVIMRFIEELSIKETASALGKTEGAVKLLQHRAMKTLQELVG
ncbi:MAG: sigma-70 family RNA polymerase sigma factor [Candidatus Liptonbacteria bacterium]|nr:sigma-70 family RNA polymerase sigma factor [Candidatus Liptonbacteria bacterium]